MLKFLQSALGPYLRINSKDGAVKKEWPNELGLSFDSVPVVTFLII
uniref:Uncharacterized protein n=1 Tax=Arundo donax TaxID=35708 RepID=A0A0A9FMQ3_ARUDO